MRMTVYILAFFVSCTLGALLGGGSAWLALKNNFLVQKITLGVWTAYPDFGQKTANPYTSAKSSQTPELYIGPGEGIKFVTATDTNGEPLISNCNYTILGKIPQARIWTMSIEGEDGLALASVDRPQENLHSESVARFKGDVIEMHIGSQTRSGNWFKIPAKNKTDQSQLLSLVLRLYDSNLSIATGLKDTEMPSVELTNCSE